MQENRARVRWAEVAVALLVLAAVAAGFIFFLRRPLLAGLAITEKSMHVNLKTGAKTKATPIGCFDQLHVDAHGVAALLHAAFQDVGDPK